jgi:hypothetical protein
MLSFKLFLLSTRHLLRISVPSKPIRYSGVIIVSLLLIGSIVLGLFLGIYQPPQWKGEFMSTEFATQLSGLLVFITSSILFIPTLVTVRASLKLLNTDEAVNLINIAPISSSAKFWSTLGPILFFSSIIYFIFFTPIIIAFLFIEPIISLALFSYFTIVSAWSIVLCFTTIVLLIDFFGKKSASRLSYVFPIVLYLLSSLFIYAIEDFRASAPTIGYWQLIFLLFSLLILPFLFKQSTKSFYNHLVSSTEPIREYAPPKWGNYNPWDYIDRKSSNWSMLPLIVIIGLMIFKVYEVPLIHEGVLAIFLFAFATNPGRTIMLTERESPIRWALAPFAEKIRKIVWLKVNLPLFLMAVVALMYVGHAHIIWLVLNLLVIIFAMAINMDDWVGQRPILKKILENVLPFSCLILQSVW